MARHGQVDHCGDEATTCVNTQGRHRRMTLSLDFQGSSHAVGEALGRMRAHVKGHGLAPEHVDAVEIVLAEVLNNIVEHGYRADGSSLISMTVTARKNGVDCVVCDRGLGMPDGKIPCPRRFDAEMKDMDDLPEGGFGWGLIHDLASDLRYTREGKENRLSFTIVSPTASII